MQTYGDVEFLFHDRQDWTLGTVLAARAASHGDKVYLRCPPGADLTFGQVNDLARRVASGLGLVGASVGDRLAILAGNHTDYVLAWFGAALAGMVEVPISPYYRGEGLSRLMAVVGPSVLCTDPDLVDGLVEAGVDPSVRHIFIFPGVGRAQAREALGAAFSGEIHDFEELTVHEPAEPVVRRPHDLASVLFTSGTTGLPKGVMMPEAQLYFFAEQFRNYERLTERDVYLSDKPLYTSLTHFHVIYACLIAGATAVLYDRFSANLWAKRVHDSGATVVVLIGEMMDFIMKQPPSALDYDNSLRCISCGPTSWSVIDNFLIRFGGDVVAEAYGQTEISAPICVPYGAKRPVGSCGVAVDQWFDIKLADPETDREVPVGELGELQLRHKEPWTINDGYYGNPIATANARRNLWFHTGDVFRKDEDGWYYFVDRTRDVIRRRGQFISSKEIEDAFMANSAVTACAAVSVSFEATDESDEVLVALVVGDSVSNEDLIAQVQKNLPYYAVPRFIRRVEALPVTPTGKVRRIEIREAGIDAATWDRVAVGVVIDFDRKRAEVQRNRQA